MSDEIMVQQQEQGMATVEQAAMAVGGNPWSNPEAFDRLQRVSKALASSTLVPQNYQGNLSNCMIAVEIANRMDMSPVFVMQNLYVVKGKPSWAGKACMAIINNCGKFKNAKHIYTGTKGTDSYGCYVTATRISDGETVNGEEVTLAMAKAEGWISNSKWKNMPGLMLAYRAASFFANVHCPEEMMGYQTDEEIRDVQARSQPTATELTAELKEEK